MASLRSAWCLLRPILSCVLTLSLEGRSGAINIVIQLQDEDQNPSYDPDGSRMAAIFNAAATYWEDYLPEDGETGTYEVDVSWSASEFSGTPDTLAKWSFQNGGDNNIRVNPNPIANDDPAEWYFDASPLESSEYDFVTQDRVLNDDNNWDYRGGQWLFRDVDASEQSSWFSGNPPGAMEIGYRGRAIDPTLLSQFDLLSTVIHELGHELGVNNTGGPWQANAFWLRSGSAVLEEGDGGHLLARTSLMCEGCGMLGTRRFPSAVDIMAVADDEAMGSFDLPRLDYVGNGDWSHLFLDVGHGWMGGLPPDPGDDAFLRSGNAVLLNVDAEVRNLLVDEASQLLTGGFALTVSEQTTIGGKGSGGTIAVQAGGVLETPVAVIAGQLNIDSGGMLDVASRIDVLDGGELALSGSIAQVGQVYIQDDPNVPSEGKLSGHGTVDAAGTLVNDGNIFADGGTLLFVSTTNSAIWNLDGATSDGVVDASSGDLTFLGALTTFDGTMWVGPDHTFTLDDLWTIGGAGNVNLLGAANKPATWHGFAGGGYVTMGGQLLVNQLGVVDIAISFESSAVVLVPGSNDDLRLMASTTYNGGAYFGNGQIEQIGSAVVKRDTAIDVRVFDWDGPEVGSSTTSIDPAVVFTINAQSLELSSTDGYDGTANVNGGILEVDTHLLTHGGAVPAPWQLDRLGKLNLKNGGLVPDIPVDGPGAIVRGSPLVVEGSVLAIGEGNRIESDVTFKAGSSVKLFDRFSELSLAGATTLLGGSYTGDGVLHQEGDATVAANTQVGVAIYDWDGLEAAPSQTTVAPGVEFTLNVGALETGGNDGHDGLIALESAARLNINTASPWRLDGAMSMDNAVVNGSPLVNFGAVAGTGAINADVTNHGTISPGLSPGILRINAGYQQEADGALDIDLAGSGFGEVDLLRVMDDSTLDGTLQVTLLNGFEPLLGNSFTILSTAAGSVTGSFSAEIMPYFNGRTFDVLYNPMSVVLEVVPGYEADFDEDGDVDADDLVKWQTGFGITSMALHKQGDANGDGNVDGGDLLVWQRQLGSPPLAASANSRVPEPATLWLFIVAAVSIRLRGGRMRQELVTAWDRSTTESM